jgi:hypothetical protein
MFRKFGNLLDELSDCWLQSQISVSCSSVVNTCVLVIIAYERSDLTTADIPDR